MAQPLPRVIKQGPNAPNEHLAYLTSPEMAHLRSNAAAPHNKRLPDKGALNTFRGVPLFYAEGVGMGGYSDAVGDAMGNAGADAEEADWGHYMDSYENQYGGIGNPGDDPRASEGGGEVIRAATTGGGGPVPGAVAADDGTDTGGGGGDPGPSDAELLAQRISDAMGAINSLFAGRQGVYDKLRDSSYALSQSGIADSYQRAARKLGFQMLRQGQDTGQVDIDLRSDLSKLKNDSLADAMRHAQGLSEGMRTRDSAKRAGLRSQALTGNLTPGQVGGLSGTLSAGVPQSWSGISDIGWNIPSGFAPGGGGGFMPNWKDMGNATPYFGASS